MPQRKAKRSVDSKNPDDRRSGVQSASKTSRPTVEELFPTVAQFVRGSGWIEIGDQEGVGFVARAVDYGGLAFEDRSSKTLGEALAVLDRGLA